MPKVALSTRISTKLLEQARDYVYALQGPPDNLTMAKLSSGGLRRQVDAVKKRFKLDDLPARPGGQAGRQGRRKRGPNAKAAPSRCVLSTMVTPELKSDVWDAYYLVREEVEFAEFAEEAIKRQLRYLRRRHGAPEARPNSAALKVGRRIT